MKRTLRYIDVALAWAVFAIGFGGIITTEVFHTPFQVLDTPLLWVFVGMFNLLRVRNGPGVNGLNTFCIGANLAMVTFEVVRFKMFGPFALFGAIPILCELIFSVGAAVTVEANP